MKKLLIFIMTGIFLISAGSSLAALPSKIRAENQASRAAAKQENNLDNLKKRADKMIENRINELTRLLSRIQADKKLSSDEKASLSANITTTINELRSLKAKIDGDSDLDSARLDARQIVTNFKINAIFVPKIRLIIMIDNLQALSAKIALLVPKIQDKINELKSKGQDVTNLQLLVNDIDNRLKTINNKLTQDKTTVLSISTSSLNAQKTLAEVRKDLASVRSEFAQIRHDIGRLRVDFKEILKATSSASPSR